MKRRSFADLPPDERRDLARKAGKKSGEARRKRRKLRDDLVLMLSEKGVQEELCSALIRAALAGSVRAFVVIRDTIGEKPVDALRLSGERFDELTESQTEKLAQVYLEELTTGAAPSGIADLLPIEEKKAVAFEYMGRFERSKDNAEH